MTGERPPVRSSSSEKVESMTEKVSILDLHVTSKNLCGAAGERVRKARIAKATSEDSGGGQTLSAPGG